MASLVNTFFLASIALPLFSPTVASVVKRTNEYTLPACSVPFTPFSYVGCYGENASPRTLPFGPAGDGVQEHDSGDVRR